MSARKQSKLHEKCEIDMTGMIDVVFQLLIFFMLSLKMQTLEGDFSVRMPTADAATSTTQDFLPPLQLRLTANDAGGLATIELNRQRLSDWSQLRDRVLNLVRPFSSSYRDLEIEIDCDYRLEYDAVFRAITAVSGYRDATGEPITLIERIRFTPPRAG